MYRRATATAWILLADLGTVLFTVSFSFSERTEGMVVRLRHLEAASDQRRREDEIMENVAGVESALSENP